MSVITMAWIAIVLCELNIAAIAGIITAKIMIEKNKKA